MLRYKFLTLGQITHKIDNIINRRLRILSMGTHIGDMYLSMETHRLITQRNNITRKLRASIRNDRDNYRDRLNSE